MSSPVVILRPFEIPVAEAPDLRKRWIRIATFLSGKEGFVRCELLQSMDSGGSAPFVGVLEWESLPLLHAVLEDPVFAEVRLWDEGRPRIYEPVRF